jgi:hypothetical protein
MKRILKGKKMAWKDSCKLETVAEIDRRKEKLGSVRAAIREVSEESDIPGNTLKRWYYPETDYKCTRNGTPRAPTENETCSTYVFHTLNFDSGRKKLVYGVRETDGNRLFTIQEYRVTGKGKEVATTNRLTLPLDLFCQFLVHSVIIEKELSGELCAVVPDRKEDDEVEPAADTDEGGTPEDDPDGLGVETAPSPSSTDATEDAAVESELIQCVDCVHFAVKKGAPEENGACNSRSGSWDGKVFQPPNEPHHCLNFQREEHE